MANIDNESSRTELPTWQSAIPSNYEKKSEGISLVWAEVLDENKPGEKSDVLPAKGAARVMRVKDLDNTPDSRLSVEGVAQRLLLRYGDSAELTRAVNNVFEKDFRFNGKSKEDVVCPANLKQELLQQIEKLSGNSVTHQVSEVALERLSVTDEKSGTENTEEVFDEGLNKKEKQIAASLVGLLERKIVQHSYQKSGTETQQLFQSQGHVADNERWVGGYAISAEIQKTEATVREIANQGYIALGDRPESTEKILVSRSARTDTGDKIELKSIGDIAARLSSKAGIEGASGSGLIRLPSGELAYQRMDITLMDTSLVKSLATTAKSILSKIKGKHTVVENERDFVKNKIKSVERLFSNPKRLKQDLDKGSPFCGQYYLLRTVKDCNGQSHDVREYKPLVMNFVFSGQAKESIFGNNVANARVANIDGQMRLLARCIEGGVFSADLEEAVRAYRVKESKGNRNALVPQLDAAIEKEEDTGKKLALKGMRITLTGKDKEGNSYDTPAGSAAQYLFATILADQANCALSVECKSGNDRTATAMALKCAQHEFRDKNGKDFDPSNLDPESAEFKEFAECFRKYIAAFARPNLVASRGVDEGGVPDIKTKSSPVFGLFATQEDLKQDGRNIVNMV